MLVSKTNTVADFDRSDVGSNFSYYTNSFVTQRHVLMEDVYICSAYSSMGDTDNCFGSTDLTTSFAFDNLAAF